MIALVTQVGAATGTRAAAAALACAGSDADRAALLVELGERRALRPSPIATAAARDLEERLAAHLPEAAVAARGQLCHLALPGDSAGLEAIAAALPTVREALAVLQLPPALLQAVLREPGIAASAALLRADLAADRPLTALVARDLLERGIELAVLKRPLGWLAARAALLGVLPAAERVLPSRLGRLLA